MSRTARLLLASLSLLFLLLPVATPRPGIPLTLKADEPAYYLMALSLALDRDLACETRDLERLFHAVPHLPIENLILMSTDGWRTVGFGKPFLYPLLAAPATALLGPRGMMLFNMALFLALVWMGFLYLRQFNPEPLAALWSGSFFFLSAAFAYVFWLQPEVLNMFGIGAALFCALHEPRERRPGPGRAARLAAWLGGAGARPLWSAAALALPVYNKPVLAALALPVAYLFWSRGGWKRGLVWLVAFAVALAALAGGSMLLTGVPTPYLGTSRAGFKIETPDDLDTVTAPFRTAEQAQRQHSSWIWLARVPDFAPRPLFENLGYFLWGRHTGLLLYMPFAALAVLLFLWRDRRSPGRWLILASAAGLALFLLLWIPFNWHGGGGFIGNRYFVNVYPAFLFLVSAVRPDWIVLVGYLAAGLFLTPILFTPFGTLIFEPGLQAHTRGLAYDPFPLELSVRGTVPGYSSFSSHGVTFLGRRDLVRRADPARGSFWVRGAATTELWALSAEPLPRLVFEVFSPAPDNEVTLRMGAARQVVTFAAARPEEQRVTVTLEPRRPSRVRDDGGRRIWVYRLEVATRTGRNPGGWDGWVVELQFFQGAEIVYLGTGSAARAAPSATPARHPAPRHAVDTPQPG